jgi:hypothetical protein
MEHECHSGSPFLLKRQNINSIPTALLLNEREAFVVQAGQSNQVRQDRCMVCVVPFLLPAKGPGNNLKIWLFICFFYLKTKKLPEIKAG